MTLVKLYGSLGAQFGREFRLNVRSPGEAVRALSAQLPGFKKFIADFKPGWHIFVDKENIGEDKINLKRVSRVIKIVPQIAGAKQGVFQTILGVVLIVVALVYLYFTGDISTASSLISYGSAMIFSGVIQMLTASPKSKTSQDEANGNNPSYAFNGPVNTTAQGHPVPLAYGELEGGSAVISAAITIASQSSGSVATVPVPDGTDTGSSGGDGTVYGSDGYTVFGNEGGG